MSAPAASPSRPFRTRRRAARPGLAEWEAGVFVRLRAGVAVSDIARADGCSVGTVRRIVARALAQRERDGAADYARLQIERLNDALMVATHQMAAGDLKALDRVLKVMQTQDRYHGFGLPGGPGPAALPGPDRKQRAADAPRLALPARQRALPAPDAHQENFGADKIQPLTP